jgi:hypothetical protein
VFLDEAPKDLALAVGELDNGHFAGILLVPRPAMPPTFWVASTKPESALRRAKAGEPW